MLPKRPASDLSDDGSTPTINPTQPKLEKSRTPTWSTLSRTAPAGEFAQKSIAAWSLIAPYNTGITEDQWKAYYEERSALDRLNTVNSKDSGNIQCKELGQDTGVLLEFASDKLARAICNSVLDNTKKIEITRSIRGGIYYLKLWGTDEDGCVFYLSS